MNRDMNRLFPIYIPKYTPNFPRTFIAFMGILFFLLTGCKTFTQPEPHLVLTIPTPLATSPSSSLGGILPPVVAVNGGAEDTGGAIRPTWTPLPGATQDCTLPAGWVTYSVEKGNTLSAIARWSGSTVEELAKINCIVDPTRIEIAQLLYVPRKILPTQTPTVTPTPIPTETAAATHTPAARTRIDFFYIDEVESDIPNNGEVTIRWQVTGPGSYILSWSHPSELSPVVLKQGKQGEYTLKIILPDISDTILLMIVVTDEAGVEIKQSIRINPACPYVDFVEGTESQTSSCP